MKGSQKIEKIEKKDLLPKIKSFKDNGYRIVQVCCVKEPADRKVPAEYLEMNYSFGLDFDLVTLKVSLQPNESIESITSVYGGAYLYENEIHDLYGIQINGINVDFKGTFYKLSEPTPFNTMCKSGS